MATIPGTWVPKVINGIIDTMSHIFHIQDKNTLREMIDKDPEATGSTLEFFLKLKFNRKLAISEDGEVPAPNEVFLQKLIEDYNRKFLEYKPGFIEKKIKDIALDFFVALWRNDSAYYERLGGIISYLMANHHEEFLNVDGNYLDALIDTYEMWQINDLRDRTEYWIDWGFRLIINKYKTNLFYKKSINHALCFMHLNYQNWKYDERYNPEREYIDICTVGIFGKVRAYVGRFY